MLCILDNDSGSDDAFVYIPRTHLISFATTITNSAWHPLENKKTIQLFGTIATIQYDSLEHYNLSYHQLMIIN